MYLTDSLTNDVTAEVMEEVAEKISFSQFSLPALRDFGIKFLIALVVTSGTGLSFSHENYSSKRRARPTRMYR